ncbi:MAG: type II toxin-antitoxin system Phd/YefM family antitoxin [Candidatus Dormibacteria bacterium]|jgi:prevent-host-death family protein
MARSVSVSTLKAKALGIVEEVASRGDTVIITKRNRPVARLVPMEEPATLLGSVTFLVGEDELLGPTGERWDAEPGGR